MSGMDLQGLPGRCSSAGISYRRWFRRLVLFGVVFNTGLAVPTLISPNFMLGLLGRPLTHEPMWANFVGLLLLLLSLSYISGAIDPVRFRPSAWLAVFARLGAALFFLVTPFRRDWALFGWIDMTFFVSQGLLLVLSERAAPGVLATARGR